jgi:hypothetical protein
MTPEEINAARVWLAETMRLSPPLKIIDTIEEALEVAMEKILKELRDKAAKEEWDHLMEEQAAGSARQAKAAGNGF